MVTDDWYTMIGVRSGGPQVGRVDQICMVSTLTDKYVGRDVT